MTRPYTPAGGPLYDPTGRWVWTPSGWQAAQSAPDSTTAEAQWHRWNASWRPMLRRWLAQRSGRAALAPVLAISVMTIWGVNFGEGAREDDYMQALADNGVIYNSAVHDSSSRPHWLIEGENVCTMQKNGDTSAQIRTTISAWTDTTYSAADVIVTQAEKYIC